MYKQLSIKSYERSYRGTAPTHLLSGAQSKTPCDWKSLIYNDKNKTQLMSILLDQCTTDKYATRLVDRNLSHVIDEEMFHLSCKDASCFQYPGGSRYMYYNYTTLPKYQNITA